MTCDCNTNQNNCGCSTDYAPENTIDYYYNQTDPSENKISIYEDSPILYSDTDARLLDALCNPHKIKFTDDGDSSKIEKGRKFRIPINGDNDNFAEFEILEVDHSGLSL